MENRYEQDVSIGASYLEIYNESLFDLLGGLDEAVSDKLVVTEESGVVGVKGLSVRQARSEEDALNFLFEGETNRCIGEHMLNRISSRYTLVLFNDSTKITSFLVRIKFYDC